MMTDASNMLKRKRVREVRKRVWDDIDDDCRTNAIHIFDQKKAKGLDTIIDIQISDDRFSPVSMTTAGHRGIIGSDSSSSTTNITNNSTAKEKTIATSTNCRKRLPKSKDQKESNRIASLQNRQRKKVWVHDLEQMVYTMIKHNQCIEHKNQNLINLIHDAEKYIPINNIAVDDVTNCNSNNSTAISTILTTNPMSGNLDYDRTTVISNNEVVPSYNQVSSSIFHNLDLIVNDLLSNQWSNNNPICSHNPVEQESQSQDPSMMTTSPINPSIDNATDYDVLVNSSNSSSRFCNTDNNNATTIATASTADDDDFIKNISYARILQQWIEDATQQQQRLQNS